MVVFNVQIPYFAIVFAHKGDVASTTKYGCYLTKHMTCMKGLNEELLQLVQRLVSVHGPFSYEVDVVVQLVLLQNAFTWTFKYDVQMLKDLVYNPLVKLENVMLLNDSVKVKIDDFGAETWGNHRHEGFEFILAVEAVLVCDDKVPNPVS